MNCSDCGHKVTHISPEAMAKGSTVREPGEALCLSCSAHRTKMVRELVAMPDDLASIRALRMRGGYHQNKYAVSNRAIRGA